MLLLSGICCLALATSCAGPGAAVAPPGSQPVVSAQADIPYYSSLEELSAGASVVVTVKVLDSRSYLQEPDYSSDDPRLNPYAGTGRTPPRYLSRDLMMGLRSPGPA